MEFTCKKMTSKAALHHQRWKRLSNDLCRLQVTINHNNNIIQQRNYLRKEKKPQNQVHTPIEPLGLSAWIMLQRSLASPAGEEPRAPQHRVQLQSSISSDGRPLMPCRIMGVQTVIPAHSRGVAFAKGQLSGILKQNLKYQRTSYCYIQFFFMQDKYLQVVSLTS